MKGKHFKGYVAGVLGELNLAPNWAATKAPVSYPYKDEIETLSYFGEVISVAKQSLIGSIVSSVGIGINVGNILRKHVPIRHVWRTLEDKVIYENNTNIKKRVLKMKMQRPVHP